MTKKKTRRRRPPEVLAERVAVVAQRLLALRQEQAMTQEELAEVVGVTQAAISRWEDPGNPTTPSAAELAELSDCFEVSADWMCGLATHRAPLPAGHALVDELLLARFESATSAEQLEQLVDCEPSFGAVWTAIPEGARIADIESTVARVKAVDRHVRKLSPRLWERWMRGVLAVTQP